MSALDGKVAVVSGGTRGIGAAIAGRLARAGASVARLGRSARDGAPGEFPCDVTDPAAIEATAVRIKASLGAPQILIVSAGQFLLRPFAETAVDDLRHQLEVNLVGAFAVCRAMLDDLAASRGHVVTIGSVADHRAYPGNAAYAASKYGLRGLHDVIAAEFAGRIRCTLISPGPTDTTAWDPIDPDGRDDVPDRDRMLLAEDVAEAVLFAVTRPPHANVDRLWLNPTGVQRS